ncbi:MAG: protein kinase [Rhodothermales bacterium]
MNAPQPPDRAARLRHLFDAVVDLPPDERAAYLDVHCADDPSLRRDLDALLQADRHTHDPLQRLDPLTTDDSIGLKNQYISHYQILERLGQGGMGVVYKARDTKLDRTVALKFLPPYLSVDPAAKKRFIQEAKAASALDDSNICTIYEIDETEQHRLFIAMACYTGETLKAKVARGPLAHDEALAYAMQIADGLARAHEAGIVHRDVKPANVMVTDRGQVKLLDFGLAKVHDVSLTKTGSTLGTVSYMSPEQAQGASVDHRTDLWSLGVVMYEMMTGVRPFRGDYDQAVIYSILNKEPTPVQEAQSKVPLELSRIIHRALQKKPEDRYPSAAAMLADLLRYKERLRTEESGAVDLRLLLRRARTPRVVVPALGVLLVLILVSVWFFHRRADIRWAREEVLPEIERLVETNWRDFTEAYALAEQAEAVIPNDPELAALMAQASLHIDIDTEPPGAAVYMKEYDEPDGEWDFIGVTPIDSIRVPIGIFRWKMEKEGYETVLAAASTWDLDIVGKDLLIPNDLVRVLDEQGALPPGMVRVPGTETPLGTLEDFFIDRYEVTNRQFKAFIDKGGYRNRDYWEHEFVRNGTVLTWEEAMAAFVDQTGRPGPAMWRAGDYPEGEDDFPVSGISWYEAAAYAASMGKRLPTGQHWGLARGEFTTLIQWPQLGGFAIFAPFSNFEGEGPVEVGSLPGITPYGVYDMAGNVREWCWNETPEGRLIRGGAWGDNTYRFTELSQVPPFDRSSINGFRGAIYSETETTSALAFGNFTVGRTEDLYAIEPVSDTIFEIYRGQFSYDDTPLNARLESKDERAEDWIHERITYDAAYGDEQIIGHLFLPKNAAPPYQTVIYVPGSAALFQPTSDDFTRYYEFPAFLSFLVKNGRAVLFPVYQGTFERRDDETVAIMMTANTHAYSDVLVQLVKDFKRSIDYLETRPEIDSSKLAYYGMSWGGILGAIIPAVEERLQTAILMSGGLTGEGYPEANPVNYIRRVKMPTLMLNGKYDVKLPYETSVKPMFDLMGTPAEHKKLMLYDTDHIPPMNESIREILAWFDRYLGPVQTALPGD